MLGRDDRGQLDRHQSLADKLRWYRYRGPQHAERAAPVEHVLNHDIPMLYVESYRCLGELLLQTSYHPGELRDREPYIHLVYHCACIGQKCATLISQHGGRIVRSNSLTPSCLSRFDTVRLTND
jgi:hypothetical protein